MRQAMLVLCVVVMGCGGGDSGKKQETSDDPLTLQEVCQEVGKLTCDKLAECGEPQGSDCKATFVTACCADNCDQDSIGENELETCLDALHDLSCEDFLGGVLPSQCGG